MQLSLDPSKVQAANGFIHERWLTVSARPACFSEPGCSLCRLDSGLTAFSSTTSRSPRPSSTGVQRCRRGGLDEAAKGAAP